ncbi:MAG: hypothetical protein HQL97_07430 [Magnetococcales bacterium]|nr:hypothetical protein [Magnetococcales bacterium]
MNWFKKGIPFHINLLSIFLLVVGTLCGALTWYNYTANSATAITAAQALLEQVNQKIIERFQRAYDPIFSLTDIVTSIRPIKELPALDRLHPSQDYLRQILSHNPQVFAVYIGYDTGDFFYVVNLGPEEAFRKFLNAPEDTQYGVMTVMADDPDLPRKRWVFLDKNGFSLGVHPLEKTEYDPRIRPWYINALETQGAKASELYVYSTSNKPGVTISQRFQGDDEIDGVFGVDMTVSHFSHFLQQQQFSESSQLFFFNGKGELTAHPDASKSMRVATDEKSGDPLLVLGRVADLHDPIVNELFFRHQYGFWENGMVFEVNGTKHIGQITQVPEKYAKDTKIAITVPLSEFLGPISETGKRSLMFAAIALALAMPIILIISVRIGKALRQLVAETGRIRQFQLTGPVEVASAVSEIKMLTQSIGAMKSALNTFGQYVPKALVHQLIESGKGVGLGGDRRTLTLMFTDVSGFTSMSETMSAEELTHKISEYLKHLTIAIFDNNGTIDKYIGDSIMAFWNAPALLDNHATHACRAALGCALASRELNDHWQQIGQKVMFTRIGLHTGDAVVGNIGSTDRMDYTAMGATVNQAARIEALNTVYGSQILITDAVLKQIGPEFVTRMVDKVLPKGVKKPVELHELLGIHDGPEALRVPEARFQELELWAPVMKLYQNRQWGEVKAICQRLLTLVPESTLANLYIRRCEQFEANPPPPDWDGTQVFLRK